MNKKKKAPPRKPFQDQPHIVQIDFILKGDLIAPGTLLRLKNSRTAWTYMCMYRNEKLETEWVDLRSPEGFKSVRPDRIAGEFIPKKKTRRRKKKSD